MPAATRQQSRWEKTPSGTPPPTISSGASIPLRTESSVDSNSPARPGRPPSRSGQSGLLTGRMGSSSRSSLTKGGPGHRRCRGASASQPWSPPEQRNHAPVQLGYLLGASRVHHRCHQVNGFGAVESLLSDQRAPSPEPDRVSDRSGDTSSPPTSLSPAPHQRFVHCPELA